ncbi:hypothetical protein [Thermofilum pendens]|uniref:Uncharacterized protein n=1 Tax=Thermofilum pendens (strain DSM 2475 / Hrk 5) TaxID=368408 RepID=A1S1D7_THEPD|nr:hypothetical protein [Thermofilum pendens]ABL79267.1 hypothetical protein Tpen_1872 [Thermofilum pendens Hrk 5]
MSRARIESLYRAVYERLRPFECTDNPAECLARSLLALGIPARAVEDIREAERIGGYVVVEWGGKKTKRARLSAHEWESLARLIALCRREYADLVRLLNVYKSRYPYTWKDVRVLRELAVEGRMSRDARALEAIAKVEHALAAI